MNVINSMNDFNLTKLNSTRIPTLIKNGLNYLPELKKWDKDYIIKNYGNLNCNYSYHARPVRSKLETNYLDFFNNKNNNSYAFTRKNYDINNKLDFIKDFTFPNPYFNKNEIVRHIFYSGPSNTGALPHSHTTAFNFMIFGKKKWIFFDTITSQGKNLQQYYYKTYPRDIQYNDWYKLEYNKLKETVPIIECIQEANDVIFIPNNYNHCVLNLEDTMGIAVELF